VVRSSSVEILRKLVGLEGHIVKITPRGCELSNGIEYCTVGVKGEDGIEYSIQAYGKEASILHNEAWMIMETPMQFENADVAYGQGLLKK
jgi:hypothetical protein